MPVAPPLTPLRYLARAEAAFGGRVAVVDGPLTLTYAELADRTRGLAGMLAARGVEPGDRVAALCANGHEMLELHYGVPLARGVLVPVNVRLTAGEVAAILEHSGARVVVATGDLLETASAAAAGLPVEVVAAGGPESPYETGVAGAPRLALDPQDELDLISIGYTSGTTGEPKGAMYTHRGAFLQALAMAHEFGLGPGTRYLWTLPMFHCNGWCFPWAVTAGGGTHVCVPRIDPARVWELVCSEGVTHLCGAPTVLLLIAEAADAAPHLRPAGPIEVATGGAPPTPTLLERCGRLGMRVTHLYGLTETYGPSVVNVWQPEWSSLPPDEQARLNARQGVGNAVTSWVGVVDPAGRPVPADGRSVGEIVVRGDNVVVGYFRDPVATEAAFGEGFLRTGDLGVVHPDGYVELRDRAKDTIISGGENISSVEVERILASHPAVLEAAVVGCPHPRWGEAPVAVVVLRPGHEAGEQELVDFVRDRAAHFKAPRRVVFEELPKTSTGKVQKHVLRARLGAVDWPA